MPHLVQVFGSVQVADFQLCPVALPSVAPHLVQVLGAVQVAALKLCVQTVGAGIVGVEVVEVAGTVGAVDVWVVGAVGTEEVSGIVGATEVVGAVEVTGTVVTVVPVDVGGCTVCVVLLAETDTLLEDTDTLLVDTDVLGFVWGISSSAQAHRANTIVSTKSQ